MSSRSPDPNTVLAYAIIISAIIVIGCVLTMFAIMAV